MSMNFTSTTQAPIGIVVDKQTLLLPRFTRKDWKHWASIYDTQILEKALARFNGNAEEEAKFLSLYRVASTSPRELRQNVLDTFEGQEYIIKKSLEKIEGMTQEQIDSIIENTPEHRIENLALRLASLSKEDDKPTIPPTAGSTPPPPAPGGEAQDDDETGGQAAGDGNGGGVPL